MESHFSLSAFQTTDTAYFLKVYLSTLQLNSIMIHGQLRHRARVRWKCTAIFVLGSLMLFDGHRQFLSSVFIILAESELYTQPV